MEKIRITILLAALAIAAGCRKAEPQQERIILNVDGSSLLLETKATAVTAIPSFLWWCATTGTSGTSDLQKYAPTLGSVSAGKIETGKYQTATPTAYNWYLSNQTMAVAASGPVITVANNSVDIIAGKAKATNSATPSVTLSHIFARTGALTFNTQTGYTVSNVSWKISKGSSGTAGRYNMATDTWTPNAAAMGQTALTSTSDMYLIPGTYTFTVTYTLTKGDYTDTFTRSGTATLSQGCVNAITATATGGDAHQIILSVSLTAWGTNSATVSTLS